MTCYTAEQGCHSSIWVPFDHVCMDHPSHVICPFVFLVGYLSPVGRPLFPSLALTHDWLLSKDLYLCQSFIGSITKGLAGKSEPPNLLQVGSEAIIKWRAGLGLYLTSNKQHFRLFLGSLDSVCQFQSLEVCAECHTFTVS